ncbi:MAG: serine protease [Clostridium sp.]|nr:serine protease [Clostridium sp.]
MNNVRRRRKIPRARFLAVTFLFAFLCLYGALYAAGILPGFSSVLFSAEKTIVGKAYDARVASLGVVGIECGDFRGSGVVIARDENGLVIVSAKHLLMYDVRAAVSFAGSENGQKAQGSVIFYSASYDLAYLYVPFSAISADTAQDQGETRGGGARAGNQSGAFDAPWEKSGMWTVEENENGRQIFLRTDDACRELRAGDGVLQVGLSKQAEPEYYTGTVQAKEVFISDYNASMLLNECYAEAGMSGGGVFDEKGRLVGVIIAGDGQGTVCMPMTTVLAEYRELAE